MIIRKKSMILFMSGILILTGCGSSGPETTVVNVEDVDNTTRSGSEAGIAVEIESISDIEQPVSDIVKETAETKKNLIRVAVTSEVAKQLLTEANEYFAFSDHGIEIITCDDYEKPNELVLAGEADASLYENEVYLESYNKKHGTELTIVERSYYEPLALYPATVSSLEDIGAGAVIAVPSGDVNLARSLYLLDQKGLIELKEGALYQASMEDVVSNPYNIKTETYDISEGFPDADKYSFIVCDHNRAMIKGIDPSEALGEENRNSDLVDMFAICLVTGKDRVSSPKIKELSKALNSDLVEDLIAGSYHDSVVDYR